MTIVAMTAKSLNPRERLTLWSLLALIAALPFSYHPLVSFGSASGMHLDGSLLYILTAVAVAVSAPLIWKQRRALVRHHALVLLVAFWLFSVLSLLWSDNPFRSLATLLFLLILIGLACAFTVSLPLLKRYRQAVLRVAFVSTGISIIWALWQIIADATGISSAFTLLPPAYESTAFGVARPTAFALEPQFLGSFLLLPFFWLIWCYLKEGQARSHSYLAGVLAVGTILLLTMSRGAIYAALVAIIVLFLLQHSPMRRWLHLGGVLLAAIAVSGLIIFSAATINQRDSVDGYGSLSKALNHLSLGTISLPAQTSNAPAPAKKSAPRDTGYITSSTDSRISMSARALSLWTTSPQTLLFGIGSGSFGATLHAKDSSYPTSSIVNNYYLEVLVETGLVGASLFLCFLGVLFYRLFQARLTLIIVILTSLLIQACFFSGNANVIHLWVAFGLGLSLTLSSAKKDSRLLQLS